MAGLLALNPPAAPAATLSGLYLGARAAELDGDLASASRLYRRADAFAPENPQIVERAMLFAVASGDVAAALPLAERLLVLAPDNRNVPLVLIAEEVRVGALPNCLARSAAAAEVLGGLLHALLHGWCASTDDLAAADRDFGGLAANETLKVFGRYHRALAHAAAGDLETAAQLLEETDSGFLSSDRRTIRARAEIFAATGRQEKARAALAEALTGGQGDPVLAALDARIAAGEAVSFTMVPDSTAGVAEAFYTMALVIGSGEQNRDFALMLSRLALHLRPDHAAARLLTAEFLEDRAQYDLALAALAAIGAGEAEFVRAETARARVLDAAGRTGEAIGVLTALAAAHPGALGPVSALADLLRQEKRFEEAAKAYTRAIALLPEAGAAHWVLFYQRGIAWEQAGTWDAAESDFRRALELQPEQPLVLNYLGYSLVEFRRNLDEAEAMIRRAVAQRPEDGYITDSLAWVLYRLDRFDEAVEPMERAVELVPFDPIINDHLGDVLWKVGRRLEARFQWKRALSFGPAEKDGLRIRRKLELGLDRVLTEEAAATPEAAPADTAAPAKVDNGG